MKIAEQISSVREKHGPKIAKNAKKGNVGTSDIAPVGKKRIGSDNATSDWAVTPVPSRSERTLRNIYGFIERKPADTAAYGDAFNAIRNICEERGGKIVTSDWGEEEVVGRAVVDLSLTGELKRILRDGTVRAKSRGDVAFLEQANELQKRILCFEGPESFDSFMLYDEINRPFDQQFWLPRRKVLLPICHTLEALEKDELDEVTISMPPRTGKTALVQKFAEWVMLRHPERSNLYCTYSDTVAKTFYEALLELLCDPATYAWHDVFPERRVAHKDSKDYRLDIDRRKHYSSFTARSLYGSLNGTCDADGYQIMDDPHSGIEEAMNRARLDTAWAHVENDFMTRKSVDKIKRIWIGTRWSLYDVISRRLDSLKNDPEFANVRFMEINIPALDPVTDESNFVYQYGKGSSTESYRQVRSSFERNNDMASWLAQFQQQPVERAGALFDPGDLRYYNGVLPEAEPDRVFAAVDPSWGGGDFCAMPVCFQYGDDLFVHDVVYTDGDKRISQPEIVNLVKKYKIAAITVEATKMTAGFADDIDQMCKDAGLHVNIMRKPASTKTSKEQRIFDAAPDIRERMVFRSDGSRSKEYVMFMQNVYSFTMTGKNAHDDASDSLAQAVVMAFFSKPSVAEVMRSPFR